MGLPGGDAGPGDRVAARLGRLIARRGRPPASLKDGGGERRHAVACLEAKGLGGPCIAEGAHAVAARRKRSARDRPAGATWGSAGGRVLGNVNQTILACLAPPTGRPKARLMPGHRLGPWADRVLPLSPSGGAKTGAPLATWPAGPEPRPARPAPITPPRSAASRPAALPPTCQA